MSSAPSRTFQATEDITVGLVERGDLGRNRAAGNDPGGIDQHGGERPHPGGRIGIAGGARQRLERAEMALDRPVEPGLESRPERRPPVRRQPVQRPRRAQRRLEQGSAGREARQHMFLPR